MSIIWAVVTVMVCVLLYSDVGDGARVMVCWVLINDGAFETGMAWVVL